MASNYDATATTGSEAIITTRILPRFQTVQERIFCGHKITHESHPPALLRTYYGDVTGQDQDEVHKAMIGNAMLNNLVGKDGTWNDKALYDFGDDWQRLLLRVPELCDVIKSVTPARGLPRERPRRKHRRPPSWRSRCIGAVAVVSQRRHSALCHRSRSHGKWQNQDFLPRYPRRCHMASQVQRRQSAGI